MKKKQKKKLLTQFRPSLDVIRTKLFHSMEEKIHSQYGRSFKLDVEKKEKLFLVIQPEKDSGEERILIPIDNNFSTILKQVQVGTPAVFESFRDKLLLEVLSIWGQHRNALTPLHSEEKTSIEQPKAKNAATQPKAKTKAAPKKEAPKKTEKAVTSETVEASTDVPSTLTLAEFKEVISSYPKFFVEESGDVLTINEQAATGPKLLASISMTEVGSFTVEKALERKYKVKLTLIPQIEAFSGTAINKR
ncbi:hypothetical protein IGI37_001909 [Enterococcus sp. AZ194]|uniref:hypothetical protein n=1 Tax=Enterococcus sp. AZ194 TaxID=2774629 RepID=UPI003F2000F6